MASNEEKEQIKITSTNAKCKNCGGNLVFDPNSQQLKCPNCESLFDFKKNKGQIKHYINDADENFSKHQAWAKKLRLFRCQECGAEVAMDNLNITTACPYCGSDYVAESETLVGLKPDVVIPFAFDEEGASSRFAAGVKKKLFVPSSLKKKLPVEKIRGIYIPAFTFDNDTYTSYSGILSKTKTHTDSKGRTYTTTEEFRISGNYTLNFRDYVIESSSKMTGNEINALLPFDMNNSYEYTDDFIRGYSVEHYDDALNHCYSLAKAGMEARIKSGILRQYDYTNVVSFHMNVSYNEELYSYRLMPIYVLEFKYKNKKYMAQMNGQTGRIGKGLPLSAVKITLLVLFIILVVVGIGLLIYNS